MLLIRMISAGLNGVEFWACNTDAQALDLSAAKNRLQIGSQAHTEGLALAVTRASAPKLLKRAEKK